MSEFPPASVYELSGQHAPKEPATGPIELSVHELGDKTERPAVVFCHGFPELAYSWRHQFPAVAAAGFRAVAPDQRGYGNSSCPTGAAAYSLDHLCGDLVDLLDALEIERAVFVGHDWGGFVAWAMPKLHPDRCAGVAGVCTPYTPFPGTRFLRSMFPDDDDMYMLWFQQPDIPERTMNPNARAVFNALMQGGVDPAVLAEYGAGRAEGMTFNPFRDIHSVPVLGEPIATPAEIDVYASTFERTGFDGGINWYRNIDANGAAHGDVGTTSLDLPCLMISGEWDPALPPELTANMGGLIPDLEMHVVQKAGHWLQQEVPQQVNSLLVDWLVRRFSD